MSKVVKINKMDVDRAAGKDPVFSAFGTCDDRSFVAKTIMWKGEPIFKLDNGRLKDSSWSRGERIAVARACKKHRLDKFGISFKPKVEQEIPTGTVIKMSFGGESSSAVSSININAKRFKNLKNYVEARRSGTC